MSTPNLSDTSPAPAETPAWTWTEADIQAIFASDHWFSTKAPPELIAKYEGMHVAIFGEEIVAGNRDFDALSRHLDAMGNKYPINRLLFRFVPTHRPDVIAVASRLLTDDSVNQADAEAILRELAHYFGTAPEDGMYSHPDAPMNRLVRDMHHSPWGKLLEKVILDLYTEQSAQDRPVLGGLYGYLTGCPRGTRNGPKFALWCWDRVDELCEATGREAVAAALRLWPAANYGFPQRKRLVRRLVRRLLDMLGESSPTAHAAAGLLWLLQDQFVEGRFRRRGVWRPSPTEVERLVQFLLGSGVEPEGAGRFVMGVVIEHPREVETLQLVERLRNGDAVLRECLNRAAGWNPKDEGTLKEVLACLTSGRSIKTISTLPLSKSAQERIAWSQDDDGMQQWRDQPKSDRRPDSKQQRQHPERDRQFDSTAA